MMELDQTPNIVNVLVFCNTSWDMLWHMWPLIRLQKLLLSCFGKDTSQSLQCQPSSWVTEEPTLRAISSVSCVSSWAFRRQEVCLTTPRLMNRWNEPTPTLMQMIGNLGEDWKADWPKHLAELLYAYNSTRLAITRYSPHYLMFGQWPCLPIDFYFQNIMSTEKDQCVNHYIAHLCEWLHKAFKEVQAQTTSKAERQRQY